MFVAPRRVIEGMWTNVRTAYRHLLIKGIDLAIAVLEWRPREQLVWWLYTQRGEMPKVSRYQRSGRSRYRRSRH